jgi:hypothetical protein
VTIIEVNAEPTPLTEEGTSDYLIQGKTGETLPRIPKEVKGLREHTSVNLSNRANGAVS